MTRTFFLGAWLTAVGLCVALLGCGQSNKTSNPSPTPPMAGGPGPMGGLGPMAGPVMKVDESSPFAAGQKVFAANNCARCHTINGARLGGGGPPMAFGPPMAGGPPGAGKPGGPPQGGFKGFGPGGPMKGGPDLGHVGKEPEHTVDWFVRYVSEPKSVKADARMPAFGTKISQPELRSLAEYLASLK